MIFTTKAEYGVRLLVELGRHGAEQGEAAGAGAVLSLKAIAAAEGLPLAYLERIVALLKKADLVESTRGAHGGYRLKRDPATISMDEVIVALEGAVAPMTCFVDDTDSPRVLCSHESDSGHGCATKLLWMRVQGGVMEKLSQTTLAELVAFATRETAPVRGAAHTGAPLTIAAG
ncbi:HTH-type transcriptional regulator CymR [Paraconexibacter sp. AEG42_29]|uniref:HTH-type transcriptional regulator CymR n=1 Tax=Paraconexibacter sp. AEG42_29 TaxID=2997339 RepID=A0AAU7AZU6_9ACTN